MPDDVTPVLRSILLPFLKFATELGKRRPFSPTSNSRACIPLTGRSLYSEAPSLCIFYISKGTGGTLRDHTHAEWAAFDDSYFRADLMGDCLW